MGNSYPEYPIVDETAHAAPFSAAVTGAKADVAFDEAMAIIPTVTVCPAPRVSQACVAAPVMVPGALEYASQFQLCGASSTCQHLVPQPDSGVPPKWP